MKGKSHNLNNITALYHQAQTKSSKRSRRVDPRKCPLTRYSRHGRYPGRVPIEVLRIGSRGKRCGDGKASHRSTCRPLCPVQAVRCLPNLRTPQPVTGARSPPTPFRRGSEQILTLLIGQLLSRRWNSVCGPRSILRSLPRHKRLSSTDSILVNLLTSMRQKHVSRNTGRARPFF